MFGFTEAELDRVRDRRGRVWRVAALTVELWIGLVGLGALGLAWLFTTPEGLRLVLERLVGDAPVRITFGDVGWHPTTRWSEPDTWRLVLREVVVDPADPEATDVRMGWLVIGMPDAVRAWASRELHFERAEVFGLRVHQHRQRPGPGWEPRRTALSEVRVHDLRVFDASFVADPDPPLLGSRVDQIYGHLANVSYAPGERLLSGEAALTAPRFQAGAIALTRVAATARAADGDLALEGTFAVSGGTGSLRGTIAHLQRRGAVRLDVSLRGVRVEQMVEAASGTAAPVTGRVDGTLAVHAGGEIPRGGAWMDGELSLSEGRVLLGPGVTGFTRDLIRIAPWVELDSENRVILGETTGRMRLDRGAAVIHELRYQATRRLVTVRGRVDGDGVDLVVRMVPESYAHLRAGFGVVLSGAPPNLRVRLAHRDELLPERFAEEDAEKAAERDARRDAREERRAERRERRDERRAARDPEEPDAIPPAP